MYLFCMYCLHFMYVCACLWIFLFSRLSLYLEVYRATTSALKHRMHRCKIGHKVISLSRVMASNLTFPTESVLFLAEFGCRSSTKLQWNSLSYRKRFLKKEFYWVVYSLWVQFQQLLRGNFSVQIQDNNPLNCDVIRSIIFTAAKWQWIDVYFVLSLNWIFFLTCCTWLFILPTYRMIPISRKNSNCLSKMKFWGSLKVQIVCLSY